MTKPLQSPFQSSLHDQVSLLWCPKGGTGGAADGTGSGYGGAWVASGTITHPAPSTAAPAVLGQMRRTRFTNVAVTNDQPLGVRFDTSSEQQFWRGNASGLGGFYGFFRFFIAAWPANTVRLFAGMATNTSFIYTADAPTGQFIGLWHDTTDGGTALSVVTRDNTTTTKTSISGVPALSAVPQGFDFHLWCPPQATSFTWRLDNLNTGANINTGLVTATIPTTGAFMGAQAGMSNGANGTVDTTTFSLVRIYCASER